MSDFFREVDEELRNDRMRAMWKRYGIMIIGLMVLIVLATAAYRGYVYWQESAAATSGDRFLQALQHLENGETASGQTILDDLQKDGSGGYPMLAKFRTASVLASQGRVSDAIGAFETLSRDSSVPSDLQDYAVLRAAKLAVDTETYTALQSRLGGLAKGDNIWRYLARETLALSAWRENNLEEAARWISQIKYDTDVPQGVRERTQILEDLIIARGIEIPVVASDS